MTDQFTVDADWPCVQGHFPGAPIVPGAYLLSLIHRAFRQRHPHSPLLEFGKVKFQGTVVPGDSVSLVWDEKNWPRGRVQLCVAGECRLSASFTVAD